MGAACVWRSLEGGWTGCRFQLGKNKEVFDGEVFAIWQALLALERRNESGRRYTIFVDSTAAITRVRDDARSPGQRFGVAAIEVESRPGETSLAHMARVATEARSKAATDWVTAHVRPGRRYRPPPGKGMRRT